MTDVGYSKAKIQLESVQFRAPGSENALQEIGGAINQLLDNAPPPGTIVYSLLDETTFQAQAGTNWVLAQGQDISGSRLAILWGINIVPDFRGVYVRGRNYARSTSTGNAAGDFVPGTYENDRTGIHSHTITSIGHTHTLPNKGIAKDNDFSGYMHTGDPASAGPAGSASGGNTSLGATIDNSVGPESAPRSITMNCFLRID